MSMITAYGQIAPKWSKKVQKSIFSVTTYDSEGNELHKGTGFFIGSDGDAISDYHLFENASSARLSDQSGNSNAVAYITGANDTYGIIRFHVDAKKNSGLQKSITVPRSGDEVYSIVSSSANTIFQVSTIGDVTSINDSLKYYSTTSAFEDKYVGCPAFNSNGDLIGIVQPSSGGKGYILDINFVNTLHVSAISNKSTSLALNKVKIPKGLPDSMEESLVYLYFKSRSAGNDEYVQLLNMFIERYPNNPEGYLRRATPMIDMMKFDAADTDLNTYMKLSKERDVALYNAAQTIYSKLRYQPEPAYDKWNYDKVISMLDEAISISPKTEYKMEKALVYTGMKEYDKAMSIYEAINNSAERSPDSYIAASLTSELRGDSLDYQIQLMDSALAMVGDPLPAEVAEYVLRRGRLNNEAGKYRAAVRDYNEFYRMKEGNMSANFYYDRSLIETNARMYQQALDDLDKAIELSPSEPVYYLEKSALHLRVNQLDECISMAEKCISLSDQYADAYRILGYAQIQKGDKTNGLKNLTRAKELGDTLSQDIIDKFLK